MLHAATSVVFSSYPHHIAMYAQRDPFTYHVSRPDNLFASETSRSKTS